MTSVDTKQAELPTTASGAEPGSEPKSTSAPESAPAPEANATAGAEPLPESAPESEPEAQRSPESDSASESAHIEKRKEKRGRKSRKTKEPKKPKKAKGPKGPKGAKEKRYYLRWRGALANEQILRRVMCWVILAVTCVSFTFSQLGFVGFGLLGEGATYMVVLLLPIAACAVLLGTLPATALGALAGVALLGHSAFLPLDYYELAFVTPFSSIAMLTFAGLLLGLLLSFVLRNDPPQLKRVVYITIACVIASAFYSWFFFVNAMVTMTLNLAQEFGPTLAEGTDVDYVRNRALEMLLRLGSGEGQVFWDAVGMAGIACVADFFGRKMSRSEKRMNLRHVFASWLAVVFFLAFMTMSAVNFVAISQGEIARADDDIRSEVNYLCTQMQGMDERTTSLSSLLDSLNTSAESLSEDDLKHIVQLTSYDKLLDGYTEEDDGTVFVMSDGIIYMSNDKDFPAYVSAEDALSHEVDLAIPQSTDEDAVKRIIFDENGETKTDGSLEDGNIHLRTTIGYLYAKQVADSTVVMIRPASMVFEERGLSMSWMTLSFFVLLAAVIGLIERLLNRAVVKRIESTNGALERITHGDLDARVEVRPRDTSEFESLSTGINDTVVALKGWISEAETRMDAELATAKAIQESALPRIFPPYPDIARFDIYASMKPAREVGGDFYDFFLIGDSSNSETCKLGFLVADVSGKGVPAALFMMRAKTLIRDYMMSGLEPGEAVENANRQLCDGNDAGMFVTAFVGVLDYTTGHIEFVNAGHNPPLFWQDGHWRWMKEKSGLPLGLFDGLPYDTYSVDCQIGDQLLMYTDGVTEAMNVDNELYGEGRLEAIAEVNFTRHPRALVNAVRRDVAKFARGAEQSDDITILALEFGVPPEVTSTLVVPALVSELPHVNEFIHTELDRRLCPLRAQNQLDIAVEELFVNVAHYAYPEATPERPGMARVSFSYSAEPPSIQVNISDDGIPYNPLAKPDAVTPDDIMDVPIGGLGILMAKRSVDEMTYERIDESNVVSIVKKW